MANVTFSVMGSFDAREVEGDEEKSLLGNDNFSAAADTLIQPPHLPPTSCEQPF